MSDARKLSLWLDGVGWLSADRMSDVPEGGADPDGSALPQIPGTQRLYADGGWYYCTTPQNLAVLMQAGGQVRPADTTQSQSQATPSQPAIQMNPMAMMQNAMAMQMMKMFGMGPDTTQQETRPPLDLSQLKEPAAILGEKFKEAVIGAVQIWRAVKG